MKRAAPFVIAIFLAGLAFWFRDWWLPGRSPDSIFLGYVEAETSLISASASGKLSAVQVGKGQAVKEGDPLFAIDDAAARAEVARAEAAVATAKANLANLETGRRPLEIEQIEAQLAEAEANVELAMLEYNRLAKTMGSGATSYSQFDKSKATLDVAEARARQLRAAIASARLPARTDEITAAEARVLEAEATLQAARSRLGDHRANAPSDGLVESVFFAKGETVAAGQPVVELRNPQDNRIIFFVPEMQVARALPGASVTFTCDSCEGGKASIAHVDATPEYTPPVIYSQSAKPKLVFRAEAKPEAAASLLPGVPVTVEFAP